MINLLQKALVNFGLNFPSGMIILSLKIQENREFYHYVFAKI